MMTADGAAAYSSSTLVPFRFGFGVRFPRLASRPHARESKTDGKRATESV